MPDNDREKVTIAHPGILKRGRVMRSALNSLGPGWRVVGDGDAPVKPRSRASRKKKTSAAVAGSPEQVSDTTTSPAPGTEKE